ncbi:peptidylprolyl isomerase [Pycnococcus provasolii]
MFAHTLTLAVAALALVAVQAAEVQVTKEQALPYLHNNTKGLDLAHFHIEEKVKGTGDEAFPGTQVLVTIAEAKAIGQNSTEGVVYQSNMKLHFEVGTNQVPLGINVGMFRMRVGGHRVLTVPPTMGEHMHHPRCASKQCLHKHIPMNATLVIDFTLDAAGDDVTPTTQAPVSPVTTSAAKSTRKEAAAAATTTTPEPSSQGRGGGGNGLAIGVVFVFAVLGVGAYVMYTKFGKGGNEEPKFDRLEDIEMSTTSSSS